MEFLETFGQILTNGLTRGSIYALVALGFTVIYNTTDVINFAQGEFAMLGGMVAVALLGVFGLPLPVAVIGSVGIVILVGAVTQYTVLGRSALHYIILAGLSYLILSEGFELGHIMAGCIAAVMAVGLYFIIEKVASVAKEQFTTINMIIITIGLSIFLKGLASLIWGKDYQILPAFSGEEAISIMNIRIAPQNIWIWVITIIAVTVLHQFYKRTITGKALRACAHNPETASLMGIGVKKMVLITFAFSGGLGAIAGIVITPIVFTNYQAGTMIGLKGFCAAILGGIDSITGAVVGGLAIGIMESMFGSYVSSGYMDAFAFIIMLMMLFLRPQGLIGKKSTERA